MLSPTRQVARSSPRRAGRLANTLGSEPVVVFRTDKAERAVGQAAAKVMLSKWRKLPLAIEEGDRVPEAPTAASAHTMANVN
ncbi:MAG TPA: hypothetical protein VFK02_21000, partial [Kofleriaceae bacterium]|nr:hypothetical protein [Kofleriaceae bacterium]